MKRRQTADGRRQPNQEQSRHRRLQLWRCPRLRRQRWWWIDRCVVPVLEGRRESHWKLILGVVGLLMLGLLGAWVLPSIETLDDLGAPPALTALGAEGRRIYLREGCQSCHTQVVRPIVTDAGLGPVSNAGSVGGFPGDTIGSVRYGPDLTHFGSREGVDLASVTAYLLDPQSVRPESLMPPIDYLDDTELEALAQFLVESK